MRRPYPQVILPKYDCMDHGLIDGLRRVDTFKHANVDVAVWRGEVEQVPVAGRCSFTPGSPWVDHALCQRLKLKYDEAVSKFAFNFNLRQYTVVFLQPGNGGASWMLLATS